MSFTLGMAGRWLEHDPQELLATVRTCITKALEATQEACGQLCVKAVGLTNQRETTIVWDRITKAALHNAIVWPDSRNSAICSRIQEQVGSRVSPQHMNIFPDMEPSISNISPGPPGRTSVLSHAGLSQQRCDLPHSCQPCMLPARHINPACTPRAETFSKPQHMQPQTLHPAPQNPKP